MNITLEFVNIACLSHQFTELNRKTWRLFKNTEGGGLFLNFIIGPERKKIFEDPLEVEHEINNVVFNDLCPIMQACGSEVGRDKPILRFAHPSVSWQRGLSWSKPWQLNFSCCFVCWHRYVQHRGDWGKTRLHLWFPGKNEPFWHWDYFFFN